MRSRVESYSTRMVRPAVLSLALRVALISFCPAVLGCGNMVTRFLATYEAEGKTASAWAKKRVLTIDNSSLSQLSNFPLLVKLNPTRINYSLCAGGGAERV